MPSNFDEIIHAERGRLIASLPRGAKVFCSAGCAGRWYFDWVEQNYGPVETHYGVELFSPKPDDLPSNVTWIQNSVSDMTDVPTGSVDLLFSGQNVEHLYFQDIVGFFQEANRVIKRGGHICVDSPNRLVTQEAAYTQPQHVLEFSRSDIYRLLEAAGFRIMSTNGIWSCEEDGRRSADIMSMEGDVEDRVRRGRDDPENAFIWWVVAQKVSADVSAVAKAADGIASTRFPAFVRHRFSKLLGTTKEIEGTEAILEVSAEETGYVFYGPYIPLREGRYQVSFMVKFLGAEGRVKLDVISQFGQVVHGERVFEARDQGSWLDIKIMIDLDDYTEGIETRLYCEGTSALVKFGTQIIRL